MKNIPKGFLFTGIRCGISARKDKNDLALFYSGQPCITAAVFTKNLFKAAPILVSREHLKSSSKNIHAIIANSGCANACTGKQGMIDAKEMCSLTAQNLKIKPQQVLVASTGVIGRLLPMNTMRNGIKIISKKILQSSSDSSLEAVKAIMTTDTFPKLASTNFKFQISQPKAGPLQAENASIWGCAKGSGMIHPDMATMLAFIFTDVNISKNLLALALKTAADETFNCISVDGDTSTNDTVFLLSNAQAQNKIINSEKSREFEIFSTELTKVCRELAKKIVRDGEGATKFVIIKVNSAKNKNEAKQIAKTIATSPLVKTAIFGCDPNWGRIIAAAGRSGVDFNPDKVQIHINGHCVTKNGTMTEISEKDLSKSFKQKEVEIKIDLNCGKEKFEYYTCDLTYDYVKINASYTT
ncbi:MAG: bifunctional glutamate N-acetyltransferase/amino-acid acetyltransferase ArgJ [Elusimicrobia bacterium]|nr:bifunctional glutamate N-acetyltransferase/amino-acid acetyltransferase ArgJ [Elusimicrobiota bacterium]MBU2614310.1 bifunctional glutamate N-acetyltransferase/amino-acid acetyltransferase ArgJ [Elusimicrobiota bacterium]